MGHADKRRIIAWLKDLRDQHYIAWIYDANDFAARTKPAVYYLGLGGIRYLTKTNAYPTSELRKRYRDGTRSETFISHSLLLADCSVRLLVRNDEHTQYRVAAKADYADPAHPYHGLHFADSVFPDLCFTKHHGEQTTTYLLELFDASLPRYRLRNRIKRYVDYALYGDWEADLHTAAPPVILLVCPTVSDLIYAKRRTRLLLTDKLDDNEVIDIRFTTTAELRDHGPVSEIWETC